jgi:hypothetical protein
MHLLLLDPLAHKPLTHSCPHLVFSYCGMYVIAKCNFP